jgi:hypothetical protein
MANVKPENPCTLKTPSFSGGVYLWRSRSDAEAVYTESWKSFVQEKYGAVPSITYFDSPVVVDNVTNEVLTDE